MYIMFWLGFAYLLVHVSWQSNLAFVLQLLEQYRFMAKVNSVIMYNLQKWYNFNTYMSMSPNLIRNSIILKSLCCIVHSSYSSNLQNSGFTKFVRHYNTDVVETNFSLVSNTLAKSFSCDVTRNFYIYIILAIIN